MPGKKEVIDLTKGKKGSLVSNTNKPTKKSKKRAVRKKNAKRKTRSQPFVPKKVTQEEDLAVRTIYDSEVALLLQQEMEEDQAIIEAYQNDSMEEYEKELRETYGPGIESSSSMESHTSEVSIGSEEPELDYYALSALDDDLPNNKGIDSETMSSIPILSYDGPREKCAICLEYLEKQEEVRMLPCAHFYHKDCIDHWLPLNGSCPVDKLAVKID